MTITWISGQRNKIRRLHERPPKFLLTGEENANIMKEISGLTRQTDKLEFFEFPVIASPNTRSLRTSPQTGVAIPRIGVPFLDNTQVDSGKQHKGDSLYDDGLP